jgi:hypothetical protein
MGAKISLIAILKRLFLGTPFSVKELPCFKQFLIGVYSEIEKREERSCVFYLIFSSSSIGLGT